ncbi:heat stress transcription factor B-2b-like [Curcuma longa]|uniref:heat stress transcription factor B-2b-like n=1 Tax=Curcuma longa TaxID=136217 RepID=UPI003D9E6A75
MNHRAESSPTAAAEGESPLPQPPALEGQQRSMPTPFLTKTYQLVDDPSMDDVISWNDDGSTFVVWRPAEFARDVLPKYFKHNNFSSFVRQLNTYGFRKIVPDRWEFANECFRRGEKRLLCEIHRRKISLTLPTTAADPPSAPPTNPVGSPVDSGDEQIISSTSSPSGVQNPAAGPTELKEENDRLRLENKSLCRELCQMKSLCNNILQLMSRYAPSCRDKAATSGGGGDGSTSAAAAEELDLALRGSSMEEDGEEETAESEAAAAKKKKSEVCSTSTRLFGVSIGFKRNRLEGGANWKSSPDTKKLGDQ